MASGLMRYAQPRAALVAQVWQELRRVQWSLREGSELVASEGPSLLARAQEQRSEAGQAGAAPSSARDQQERLVAVLRAAMDLDELGDVIATWAVDRAGERPDAQVEQVVQRVAELLDAAEVPHEPREGPPRGRGSRRGV